MSTPFSAAAGEIRAVFAQVKADWTNYTLLIETDNRDIVDLASQTNPFICASIINLSGEQLDLGAAPRTRQYGQIQLAIAAKQGKGTGDIEDLLDFIAPYFSMKDFATVRCFAISLQKPRKEKEWYYQPLIIPFYYIWE